MYIAYSIVFFGASCRLSLADRLQKSAKTITLLYEQTNLRQRGNRAKAPQYKNAAAKPAHKRADVDATSTGMFSSWKQDLVPPYHTGGEPLKRSAA